MERELELENFNTQGEKERDRQTDRELELENFSVQGL